MITLKKGDTLKKMNERLRWLKQNTKTISNGAIKEGAEAFIKHFHDGIKDATFNLIPLQEATVTSKANKGYPNPHSPLYGRGDQRKSQKDSYANMLRIRKIKNGFNVYPSTMKHWEGNITLAELFQIHEKGATIVRGNGSMIVIPKRPAFRMTEKWFETQKKNPKIRIKKLVDGYLGMGKYKSEIDRLIKNGQKEDQK